MPDILRALQHRNYRLYFFGQLVSLAGTWMQQIAMSWLTYRLTGSTTMLGLVSFAGQIPIFALAPVGGVVSDRFDKRIVLLSTQFLALVQAAILALLAFAGETRPWQLIVAALSLGLINAVDVPARQAFVAKLVDDRADLANAIALNSFTMNAARLIGPSVGGLIVGLAGEGFCFGINAASYLAVLVALAAIRTGHEAPEPHSAAAALRHGIGYAFSHVLIRRLLLIVAAVSFFVTPYTVLMPYFAREVFGGDARMLGVLLSAAGAGALLGTLYLAGRKTMAGMDRVIPIAAASAGISLAGFAASSLLWTALPALLALGFCLIVTVASSNTLIQSVVRDDMRGRVMSLFTVAFLGIAPLGSMTAGAVARLIGPTQTLIACALAVLLAVALVARHLREGGVVLDGR